MYRGGYAGKILRIDLTDKSVKEEKVTEALARDFLGGAGFAIKYLYDELKPGTSALDPANRLIFAVGPLTATGVACSSRMAVAAKSPLTGAMGMALAGGHFPAELKMAGYDMLIIQGRAEKPTYISIKDGEVKFRSAEKLMGMMTTDTQLFIKEELGDHNFRIACIGPAGERLVPVACIVNERRAAGRKGLGAVMGSKNLKAIAVRGHHRPAIADAEAFRKARQAMNKAMKDSPVLYPAFAKSGTPMVVDATSEMGILSIRNWSATGEIDMVGGLGDAAQAKAIVNRQHCHDCPVGCSQVKLVTSGPYAGYLSEGPEFETTYSLGSQVGVDYLPAVIVGDRLCDEYGIDSISAGVAIGFAMELYEKGIITRKDTDGLELKFGNHQAMIEMLRRIAYREGLGDLLGQGTRKAAAKIGQGSADFAMQIKGLELPAYDVRGAKAHGLNYATSYTGADHNRGYAFQEIFDIPIPEKVDRNAIKGKGRLTKWNQDVRAVTCDCATMCAFLLDMAVPAVACQNTADLVNAATGLDLTDKEVEKIGERLNNVARLFNIGEGFTRKDDSFPKRLMTEAIKAGASKGQLISQADLDAMLDEYYAERGWDRTGTPTPARLKALGIKSR
ncbi:MAG TPA: aldehyde ferredoxin oxidoreductase family protein [Dehalococcoidales bacterium]|nr:aldehyde ferredoxin oxidoreductase family protein [Dehalococcoidales bacterium]